MRRILRGIEIGHMTRGALSVGTGQLVIVVRVALLTGDRGMETGESPSGARVIEGATSPNRWCYGTAGKFGGIPPECGSGRWSPGNPSSDTIRKRY